MAIFIVVVLALAISAVAITYYALWRRRRFPRGSTAEEAEQPTPVATLGDRLAKARSALGGRLGQLFRKGAFDEEFWTGVEETLVAADVGIGVASEVVAAVRSGDPTTPEEARGGVRGELIAQFGEAPRHLAPLGDPAVLLVVGVNGSGKTTTVAKLAAQYEVLGARTLLGAADTFRAAADQQLRLWADKVGVEVVGGSSGADPAAVAFDAYQAAQGRGADAVIIDTAGRLHSDRNLMNELAKVVRVLQKEAGSLDEVLLVLDGTTGQNAIAQARTFTDAVGITGIVITKLDGTARGGIAVAIERELGIPVKLIGVGEGVDDLVAFDPTAFIDALLEEG